MCACCPVQAVYDGGDATAALVGSYCNDNKPTVITSSDSKLFLAWQRGTASNKFLATWKKVASRHYLEKRIGNVGMGGHFQFVVSDRLLAVVCCATISLTATGSAATDIPSFLGTGLLTLLYSAALY